MCKHGRLKKVMSEQILGGDHSSGPVAAAAWARMQCLGSDDEAWPRVPKGCGRQTCAVRHRLGPPLGCLTYNSACDTTCLEPLPIQ